MPAISSATPKMSVSTVEAISGYVTAKTLPRM